MGQIGQPGRKFLDQSNRIKTGKLTLMTGFAFLTKLPFLTADDLYDPFDQTAFFDLMTWFTYLTIPPLLTHSTYLASLTYYKPPISALSLIFAAQIKARGCQILKGNLFILVRADAIDPSV